MVKLTNKEVREALDRVYTNVPSELGEEFAQMQWMSLPK